MLDLDKIINNTISVKIFGKKIDVLEPTMKMVLEVDRIESDMTEENVNEKRMETARLFLNHNLQKREFTTEEMEKLPFEAISHIIAEISALRYNADADPNSESRFPKEK